MELPVDKNSFQFKQFLIHQEHTAMKVGTDSDLLGALCAEGNRVLDVGTGTGVLALMMAQRCPTATVTAVEIDENAVLDADRNFRESSFANRITLVHSSFQDYLKEHTQPAFDCVVCNPPYFDKSLECPDQGRARARHSSSLPFYVLIKGAYDLLVENGCFTVCLPPEVLQDFTQECKVRGFHVQETFKIKTVPRKPPKRFIVVFRKGAVDCPHDQECCMRNADGTRSEWYLNLMKDYLLDGHIL